MIFMGAFFILKKLIKNRFIHLLITDLNCLLKNKIFYARVFEEFFLENGKARLLRSSWRRKECIKR